MPAVPSAATPCLGPAAATLGPVLDQCPPSFDRNASRLELGLLESVFPAAAFFSSPPTSAPWASFEGVQTGVPGAPTDGVSWVPGRRVLGGWELARPGGGEVGRRGRAKGGGGRRLPGLRAIGRRARRQEGARERGPTPRPAEPIAGSAERG